MQNEPTPVECGTSSKPFVKSFGTSSTPKHSPTPWVSRSGGNSGRFLVEHKETKVPIALLDANVANGKNEANADFIVHAVNMHDDLVKALGDMTRRLTGLTFAISDPDYEAIEKATALLHRAKEGQ